MRIVRTTGISLAMLALLLSGSLSSSTVAAAEEVDPIYENALTAASQSLPTGDEDQDPHVYDAISWDLAVSRGTSEGFMQYLRGWQSGPGILQDRVNIEIGAAIGYETYDKDRYRSAEKAAWHRARAAVLRTAIPVVEANAQVAENRVASVYASFTPLTESVQVTPEVDGVTEVDGSNKLVNGTVEVTITVDGYQLTWRGSQATTFVDYKPTMPSPLPTKPPAANKNLAKTPVPKISGTAKVGKTLKVKPGTWKPSGTKLSYKWLRNGEPVNGATGKTYKLTAADLGAVISVSVTGSKAGHTSVTKASKSTKTVVRGTLAKGKVKVTGTKRVGKTMTAKTSKWSSGVKYHYQWYRNSRKIEGATSRTYKLTPADKGKRIKVKVWATKDGYKQSAVKTSKKTSKVKAGYLTRVTPVVTGNTVVGETLTANPGNWKPDATVFSYQWYLNGKKVKGATQASFTLTTATKGRTVKVKVTGKAAGYTTTSKYSKSTAKVTVPVPTPPSPPAPAPSEPTTEPTTP